LNARLLDFAPAAWQEYQRLRAGEIGGQVKQALEQLADDPALLRADPRSCRYLIVEKGLPRTAEVWGLLLDGPGGTRWLVIWREMASVIEIGYIGPVPGIREVADQHRADSL
jgi:hypothetical protein